MLANYREALKNPAIAHPQYLRLDLETEDPPGRRHLVGLEEGREEKNLDILDNLPAIEEELAPENVLPEGLVDPLPFLNAGLWEKVHIASLVPKEKIKLPEEPKARPAAWEARDRGGMGSGQMADAMQRMNSSMMNNMQRQSQNISGGAMMEMMSRNSMGAGGGGLGSSESAGNFWKSRGEAGDDPGAGLHGRARSQLSLPRPDRRLQPQLQPRRHQSAASTTRARRWPGPGARRPTS